LTKSVASPAQQTSAEMFYCATHSLITRYTLQWSGGTQADDRICTTASDAIMCKLVGSLTSQYQLADAVTHVWKLFRYWSWCCKCISLLHEMLHLAACIHAMLYNNTDQWCAG